MVVVALWQSTGYTSQGSWVQFPVAAVFFSHSFNVRQSFNQSTLDWKGPCSHVCIVNFEFVSNFDHDYNHSKVLIMITLK